MRTINHELNQNEIDLARAGQKLRAIKAYFDRLGTGLKAAKEAVEAFLANDAGVLGYMDKALVYDALAHYAEMKRKKADRAKFLAERYQEHAGVCQRIADDAERLKHKF